MEQQTINVALAFKGLVAAIGAFVGYFFGKSDGFFYAVITFVILDYITGVLCAIVKRELSSEIGYKGIFKKIAIFVLIGIANVIDVNILNGSGVLRTTVIFFYIANEGISILENAAVLGLPIPANLVAALQQLKKKDDGAVTLKDETEKQNDDKE